MSQRSATARSTRATRTPPRRRRARPRAVLIRRLVFFLLAVIVLAFAIGSRMIPLLDRAVDEIALPLEHEEIIRAQARDKDLDPALVAAVIYAESSFRDQTSPKGAKGLMQIMPETADYIAHKSGGTQFEQGDLGTPRINIAYGSWYLRYLLDRYHGNHVLAIAAYNGGEGQVDSWLEDARRRGKRFRISDIPFPETRAYVGRVLEARERYRREHAEALGL